MLRSGPGLECSQSFGIEFERIKVALGLLRFKVKIARSLGGFFDYHLKEKVKSFLGILALSRFSLGGGGAIRTLFYPFRRFEFTVSLRDICYPKSHTLKVDHHVQRTKILWEGFVA